MILIAGLNGKHASLAFLHEILHVNTASSPTPVTPRRRVFSWGVVAEKKMAGHPAYLLFLANFWGVGQQF